MAKSETTDTAIRGAAALSICESLLIALNDLKVLSDKDARAILEDAVASHRHAVLEVPIATTHHLAVATLIENIIAGRNSVRKFE